MFNSSDIHCLCCKRKVNFITVEPEFYCESCVRRKQIHSSEKAINPVRWYHQIYYKNQEVQKNMNNIVNQIKNIVDSDKIGATQLTKQRVEEIRLRILHLQTLRDSKIKMKNKIVLRRHEINKRILSKFSSIKNMTDITNCQSDLVTKTMTIQAYLNQIQCLFVREIFQLLPINISKYGLDTISGLPLSIKLSDAMLEPNDETASAILLLIILSSSISFILDLYFSSMNIREFAVATLCRLNQPLKRDEIMSVYEMLVKIVHHIIQATLYRVDIIDLTQSSNQNISLYDSFSVKNYPLKNLAQLNDNITKAVMMNSLSNPYILQLPKMFVNSRLDDFSNCPRANQLNGLSHDTNSLDFVEISSNIPFDDVSYELDHRADFCDSGASKWPWFKWV